MRVRHSQLTRLGFSIKVIFFVSRIYHFFNKIVEWIDTFEIEIKSPRCCIIYCIQEQRRTQKNQNFCLFHHLQANEY